MKTTLKQIRAAGPCGLRLDEDGQRTGYLKLKHYLGRGYGDNTPISLVTVLDSNGLDDAHWCFQAVEGHDREKRLYGVWCVRDRFADFLTDEHATNALRVSELYANGQATDAELAAAEAAVWAVWAAWDDASDTARVAAWDDARDAARAAQANELRRVCACIDAGEDPYPFKGIGSDSGARPAAQESA